MPKKLVSVMFDEEDLNLLNALAKQYKTTRSDIIRTAFKEYAKNHTAKG